MSDIGNGRAGHADVVIVGAAQPAVFSPAVSARIRPGRSCCSRQALPTASMAIRMTCAIPTTCPQTPSTNGASRPGGRPPRRKLLPRAPRYSADAAAHNATVAMRARPADILDWPRHGLDDWTVESVYETFRSMENTPDGDDADRGRTGPFPIRQQSYDDLTPSQRGFIDATAAEGFDRVVDFNVTEPGGVGAYPVNVVDGVRQTTASFTSPSPFATALTSRSQGVCSSIAFCSTEIVRSALSRQAALRSTRAR